MLLLKVAQMQEFHSQKITFPLIGNPKSVKLMYLFILSTRTQPTSKISAIRIVTLKATP